MGSSGTPYLQCDAQCDRGIASDGFKIGAGLAAVNEDLGERAIAEPSIDT
jgi:hypothetical protein